MAPSTETPNPDTELKRRHRAMWASGDYRREEEFDQALRDFCEEWNSGSADDARFEKEYLVAVGRKSA
jgi:hypothetical protein